MGGRVLLRLSACLCNGRRTYGRFDITVGVAQARMTRLKWICACRLQVVSRYERLPLVIGPHQVRRLRLRIVRCGLTPRCSRCRWIGIMEHSPKLTVSILERVCELSHRLAHIPNKPAELPPYFRQPLRPEDYQSHSHYDQHVLRAEKREEHRKAAAISPPLRQCNLYITHYWRSFSSRLLLVLTSDSLSIGSTYSTLRQI